MPQWAGSSWYELRYTDPHNPERVLRQGERGLLDGPAARRARPGRSRAASTSTSAASSTRCCTCCIRGSGTRCSTTSGHVSSREPYRRLVNQGYIQAFAYTDARGAYVPAADVVERDGKFFYPGPSGEIEVFQEFGKIGKSLKNSISPDEICDDYGADTLRVYEMSMGPLEASRPWATKDVVGAHRFLQRVWRLVVDENTGEARVSDARARTTDTLRLLHRTIAGCLRRLCGAAQQHRGGQADRVHQPPDQAAPRRPRRGRRSSRWC